MAGIAAIADAYVRAGRAGAAVALLSRLDGGVAFASVHVAIGGGARHPVGGGGGSRWRRCRQRSWRRRRARRRRRWRPPPSWQPPTLPLTPDLSTYNVCLKALREAPAGTITAGLDVVSRMKRAGVAPDHVTLLTLTGLCGRKGGAASAAGVLDAAVAMGTGKGAWGGGSVPLPPAWKARPGRRPTAAAEAGRTPALPATGRGGAPASAGGGGGRRPPGRAGRAFPVWVRVPTGAKASIATFNAVIRAHLARASPDIPAATALYARAVALSTTAGLTWYAPDGLTYTLLVDGVARAAAASPRGGEAVATAVAVAVAVVADMEAIAMAAAAAATEEGHRGTRRV